MQQDQRTPHTPAVLVVDDEYSVRRAIGFILRARGMEVFEARDAVEAELLLSVRRIDSAVIDLMLPGKDGLQLAEEIARLRPGISFVLISAHAESPIARRAQAAYPDRFLDKAMLGESLVPLLEALQRGTGEKTHATQIGE